MLNLEDLVAAVRWLGEDPEELVRSYLAHVAEMEKAADLASKIDNEIKLMKEEKQ